MTTPTPIPTICDLCRAKGQAGDAPFADLDGLLDFEPVAVRSHANNWTPEHQRAFIAALAITGNVRPAARSIGRYANGAERLRKLPRARAFAEAWDNALDLYRERELAIIKSSLTDLEADHKAASANAHAVAADMDYHRVPDEIGGEPDWEDTRDAYARMAERLWMARHLFLRVIADSAEARAAWETLCGEIDWDAVERDQPQPGEADAIAAGRPPLMRDPDMVISCEWIDVFGFAVQLCPDEGGDAPGER